MSTKRYLCIKNFDATQMYKDRNPIWIKLHCALLDDYDFSSISDATKFHAVGLMILASRLNNKFPHDEAWLRRKINANSEINIEKLLEIGFLEVAKDKTIARNLKKTKAKSVKQSEKLCETEQNRTEQNKTEENTTQQNTTDETRGREDDAAPDAAEENRVVLCELEKSSEIKSDDQNRLAKKSPAANGHLSMFSLEECFKYAQIADNVRNPRGLANNLYQTGAADVFILAALYPEKLKESERNRYGEARKFLDEPCAVCFGAKMEIVPEKGARSCSHCKNERGKSTGLEPVKEN